MKLSPFVERIAGTGSAAWDIHVAAKRAKENGEDVIVLSVGDPDFSTPSAIVEGAVAALRAGDTHYTGIVGRDSLRAAVAADFSKRTGVAFGPENVMMFAGTQNALFATSLCLLAPGDEVITLDPAYVTYEATLQAPGATLVRVPQAAETGFRPDPAAIAARITPRTRAIALATPNNPTGVMASADELAAIAGMAIENDLWVISDEVYGDLAFEDEHRSIAALAGMAERTVTVSGLSKSHAMTGWRIGWAVGPAELIPHFNNLGLCMLYGLPGFIQSGAEVAMTQAREASGVMRDIYRRRRGLVSERLGGVEGISVLKPQAGMFVLVDIRDLGMTGSEFAWGLYEKTGVSVLDAGAFGRSAEGWVRLSFSTGEKELSEACDRIAKFVAGL